MFNIFDTVYLRALHDSYSKQRLLLYTALFHGAALIETHPLPVKQELRFCV
jgi:hypothetical protein